LGRECPIVLCTPIQCGTLNVAAPSCDTPIKLPRIDANTAGWQTFTLRGNLECLQRGGSAVERAFVTELDFLEARETTTVQVTVDAEFDPAVLVERGPCDDPARVAANRDHAPGVERSALQEELSAGTYRLVVTAEDGASTGEFVLSLAAYAKPGQCAFGAANDACSGAIELDPTREIQTTIGSLRCASDDSWAGNWCHDDGKDPDVYFRLDLTDRRQRTLLRASTNLPPTNGDTTLYLLEDIQGHCFGSFACSGAPSFDESVRTGAAELWADLEPGNYYLAVDGYSFGEVDTDFGLLVQLSDVVCPPNRSVETATELAVVFDERSYPYEPWCASRVNELFYRLDLRQRDSSTRVRLTSDRVRRLSIRSEDARTLVSDRSELVAGLEPDLYFVVITLDTLVSYDSFNSPEQYHPGVLTVEMLDLGSEPGAPCIDEGTLRCVLALDLGCCNGEDGSCRYVFGACGLNPEVYDCVCERAPECCDSPSETDDCGNAVRACELFCPELNPFETCL
jgi:hypothetical protein